MDCDTVTLLRLLDIPQPSLTGLEDNSPTNQLAVSQVTDWITHGLVNSPTANF